MNALTDRCFQVRAIDLPSGNASRPRKVRSEVPKDYKILVRLFDELPIRRNSIENPFVIIGPSMGGWFAFNYAVEHPKEVGALALICPSLVGVEESELSSLEIPFLLI